MLANRQITLGSPTGVVVDRDTLVKSYLAVTGTSEDTLLDLWIAGAVTTAESYCDRFFLSRTVTEKLYDEIPSRRLVLAHKPVTSVTSILDSAGATVPSGDYSVDLEAGIITLVESGNLWAGDYTVTYVSGWLAAAIPESVKIGVLEIIKQARTTKTRNSDIVIEQSPDIGSVTYRGAIPGITSSASGGMPELPMSAQRALRPYRRRWA